MAVHPTKVLYHVRRIMKRMWFRAFTYALIGVLTAVLGLLAQDWISVGVVSKVGADAVGNLLSILASSMLAVATFSLSTMVTAFGNIASGATPRASRLLMENQTAQRAVATFIGAFLYSVVGIVALTIHAYGESGRFILFLVTILVIIVIVITLIRWLDQLSTLGLVGNTIAEVEKATLAILERRARAPLFSARLRPTEFSRRQPIFPGEIGFLSLVDFEALQNLCAKHEFEVNLSMLPGSFAYPGRALAYCTSELGHELRGAVAACFMIEEARTFDQDPRLGFVLLSEIACKALSTAMNDSGTAIEAMSSGTRILTKWSAWQGARANEAEGPISFDRIFVPAFETGEMLFDLFAPIARDGAAAYEVMNKIMHSLNALRNFDSALFDERCTFLIEYATEYAERELKSDFEKKMIRGAASRHEVLS